MINQKLKKTLIVLGSVAATAAVGAGVYTCVALGIFQKEYTATCLVEGSDYREVVDIKRGERFKCTVPSKEHYTFLYYADEYGVAYTDAKGYSLKKYSGREDLTLIAQWKGDDILVRFDADEGTLLGGEYCFVEYGSSLLDLEVPEKAHCEFIGWYGTNSNNNSFLIHDGIRFLNPKLTITDENFRIVNNEITLSAEWNADDIVVRLDVNGGQFSGQEYYTIEYGSELPTFESPVASREGYEFIGWYGINSTNGSFLVQDDTKFSNNNLKLMDKNFQIVNNTITLTAQYDVGRIAVTCIYEDNSVKEETVVKIPYGSKIQDCSMPTILNQYNERQGFIWSIEDDFESDEYLERVYEPITLYAVAMETEYFGYKARQSFDLSKLNVDFRTANKVDVNDTYITASGTKEVTFVGNPSVVYTNFSIVVSATVSDLKITFVDFNYIGRSGAPAFDASGLSNNTALVLNAKGNSSIRGADGTDGANGVSYGRNDYIKHQAASHGGSGGNGSSGQTALCANTIKINIYTSGSLSLYGGNGGNGGTGGNGQGSKNDGIAQAGHGGSGGNGGKGGDGLYIYGTLSFECTGRFYTCGGNGGSGGSGGNNQDKGAFDRADNGGNGGKGGDGGAGGSGVYAENFANISNTEWTTAFAVDGNGGNGANGGDGGETGKNEFQTVGGTPGAAGGKGIGGNMGSALNNCIFEINTTDGNAGTDGNYGISGTKS